MSAGKGICDLLDNCQVTLDMLWEVKHMGEDSIEVTERAPAEGRFMKITSRYSHFAELKTVSCRNNCFHLNCTPLFSVEEASIAVYGEDPSRKL